MFFSLSIHALIAVVDGVVVLRLSLGPGAGVRASLGQSLVVLGGGEKGGDVGSGLTGATILGRASVLDLLILDFLGPSELACKLSRRKERLREIGIKKSSALSLTLLNYRCCH